MSTKENWLLATLKRRPLPALVAAAVVLCGAVAFAWSVLAKDEALTPAQTAADLMQPGPLPELVLGRDDAPVTIVEYADLTCPHCAAFHKDVLPLVKERFIDTGKARLVFRGLPLNVHSLIAFMSVHCVAPQNAFPLVAALFTKQDDWTQAESTSALADKLFAFGQQTGGMATRQAFDECVPSQDKLTTDRQKQLFGGITKVAERAEKTFGVNSTPTFFINGEKLAGAATIENLEKAINGALSR